MSKDFQIVSKIKIGSLYVVLNNQYIHDNPYMKMTPLFLRATRDAYYPSQDEYDKIFTDTRDVVEIEIGSVVLALEVEVPHGDWDNPITSINRTWFFKALYKTELAWIPIESVMNAKDYMKDISKDLLLQRLIKIY